MDFVAQAVGIIAMAVSALSLAQKNTKTILIIQIFSNILFGTHYFLLGAYAGAALNVLSMVRSLIIRQKNHKWANPKIWFPIFVLSFAVAVYFSGDGLLGLLPFAGCIFMTIAFYIDDGTKARRFIACSSPCWMTYNALSLSIGGVIAEIINICSLISAFIRFDMKKSKKQKTPSKLTRDFTKGNIAKQLLWFTLPFMASNALQVLYSTIDMIIVGQYVGTDGLSAVAQSSQLINFAAMVCLGFSNAGQVLISQAIGSGKREKLSGIIGTLFGILMVIALIFTGVFIVFKDVILTAINMPKESYNMGIDYLVICGGGMVFTAGYNMVSAVLRGMGDSKRPLLFIVIASVVNLVLDYIFTGLMGFGVAGAAWATIIGQAVSFIFSVYYLYKNKQDFGFNFKKESFKINKNYSKMIINLGTPMAIQSGFINVSMLFVNSLINSVGVVASATFGVGVRIDDIVNKICMGIQYAAIPMISQNIGAGRGDRAKKVVHWAWIYSGALTVFFIVLYIFFGGWLFKIFSDDPLVHEMSGTFISAILWMFPAFAVMRGSGAFIQGIGHSKLSMVLALLDGVFLRIGLSFLFGIVFEWGFFGFVLGYALAPYGFAIPSMIYFLSGKWKQRQTLAERL